MTQQYITEEGQNFQQVPPAPQFPHQAPAPTPLTKRRWFLPVAVAAGVLVGSLVTGTYGANVASAKAANCSEALNHADTALGASAEVIGYLSDGLGYAASFDADGLGRVADKIEPKTAEIKDLTPKYKTARDLCTK